MFLTKTQAVGILAIANIETTITTPAEELVQLLTTIPEVLPEDAEVPDHLDTPFDELLIALEEDDIVEIKKKRRRPKREQEKQDGIEKRAKIIESKATASAAASKATKKKRLKKPQIETVRALRVRLSPGGSRPYIAGVVLKAFGMDPDVGITDEMVAEVDRLYGRPNERESEYSLRNAWHAIHAFNITNKETA